MYVYEDVLVILIADFHKSAAEAIEIRRRSRELRERWERNHTELSVAVATSGTHSLDKVQARRARGCAIPVVQDHVSCAPRDIRKGYPHR